MVSSSPPGDINVSSKELEHDSTAISEKNTLHFFKLCTAAAAGDADQVAHIIKVHQLDPRMADYDKRTALHIAASEGHAAVVEALLAAGANPKAVDRWGHTALDDARHVKAADVIDLLSATKTTEGVGALSSASPPSGFIDLTRPRGNLKRSSSKMSGKFK